MTSSGIVKPVAGFDTNANTPDWSHDVWLTPGEIVRLHRLERAAARKRHSRWDNAGGKGKGKIGSNERNNYQQIIHLNAKAARRRNEWHHQTSRIIADTYAYVALEGLNIPGMTKQVPPKPDPNQSGQFLPNGQAAKTGLNKAILNEGWGHLAELITYKTLELHGTIQPVPPQYTSQTCHACWNRAGEQRENQATFACANPACLWTGNADTNAAAVILITALAMGLNMARPTECGAQPASSKNTGHPKGGRDTGIPASMKREKRHAQNAQAA